MPRPRWLPGFPEGTIPLSESVSVLTKEEHVTYFVSGDNIFSHPKGDQDTMRFVIATLMESGHLRACELEQAPLCIPHRTLMNWGAQLRNHGPGSFFRKAPPARNSVMTPQKIAQCQKLLAEGKRISQAARAAGITDSTLRKAIERGELIEPVSVKSSEPNHPASTKAERSRRDAEAAEGMGTACTRADERMAAAIGLVDGALTRFERCSDVPMGGLLAGLPALCANGLLSGIGKYLSLPKGFYGIVHILLTMAFMALARIRRPEGLRHIPPGEGASLLD